jgi:hypothetical protein
MKERCGKFAAQRCAADESDFLKWCAGGYEEQSRGTEVRAPLMRWIFLKFGALVGGWV